MNNKKITEIEKDKIYAAIKLIEYLAKQGKLPLHVFQNILDEYNHIIDLNDFQYCFLHT